MTEENEKPIGEVKLQMVRLSFPHLKKPSASVKDGPEKFRANLLVDPDTKEGKRNLKALNRAREEVEQEVWGRTGVKFKDGRICFKEGDEFVSNKTGEPYNGYEGMWAVSAANASRPTLVDRRRQRVEYEDIDETFYAGCYVNAIIRMYAVKDPDKGGNGLFASLEGLQFVQDGEAFAGGGIDEDAFDDLGDFEDDDEDDDEDLY